MQRLGMILLVIATLAIQPMLLIWALNILLPITIPFEFWTITAAGTTLFLVKPVRLIIVGGSDE